MIKASCDIIYILSQKALLLKRILKFTENFSQAQFPRHQLKKPLHALRAGGF
jgi:hypothetical protein